MQPSMGAAAVTPPISTGENTTSGLRVGTRLREILLVEAADEAAAVVLRYVSESAPFAGQETAAERRPSDDAYAERPGRRDDIHLESRAGRSTACSKSESGAMGASAQCIYTALHIDPIPMERAGGPGEPAWGHRAARHLIVACTQAPLDFDGGDGLHGVCAAQLVGGAVGEAHVLDLALVHQSLAHAGTHVCSLAAVGASAVILFC